MDLAASDIAKSLKAGARPVYYLLGEESADKDAARRLIEKTLACDEFNSRTFSGDLEDNLPNILSELQALPVFSNRRLVVVKAPSFPAAIKKALVEYLKSPSPQTTLLLVSDEKKADAKDALASAARSLGRLCVFAALKDAEAAARLRSAAAKTGKTLPENTAALLVRELGPNWAALSQELEKLLLFSKGPLISEEDALACLGYRRAADPFALSRLIQDRKLAPALSHLRRFLDDGKPQDQAFRALSQISTALQKQLRAKAMLAARAGAEDIFRALRLHSYWDRDFLAQAARLSEARLSRDVQRALLAERALKSQSWRDPRAEVENLVVMVCQTE